MEFENQKLRRLGSLHGSLGNLYQGAKVFEKSGIELLIQFSATRYFCSSEAVLDSGKSKRDEISKLRGRSSADSA